MIDAAGCVKKEFSARSYPEDLANALDPFSDEISGIGLEAGPMSGFLVEGLKQRGLDSFLMETRRDHAALSAIPVKTDRRDARRIAELLRMDWYTHLGQNIIDPSVSHAGLLSEYTGSNSTGDLSP